MLQNADTLCCTMSVTADYLPVIVIKRKYQKYIKVEGNVRETIKISKRFSELRSLKRA
jgi:hypothetical protein